MGMIRNRVTEKAPLFLRGETESKWLASLFRVPTSGAVFYLAKLEEPHFGSLVTLLHRDFFATTLTVFHLCGMLFLHCSAIFRFQLIGGFGHCLHYRALRSARLLGV